MNIIPIILFSLVTLIGIFMVVIGVRYHRSLPKIGLVHGGLGLFAMLLLILQILDSEINKYNNVAALLIIFAIIGGFMLFALREEGKPPVMMMVAIHAIMAFSGVLLLYLGYFY